MPLTSLRHVATLSVLGLGLGMASGCSQPRDDSTNGSSTQAAADSAASHDEHAHHNHPTEGLHHGELIELGDEEYHAEIVHDDSASQVTIYLLDSAVTRQIPVELPHITINAKHDGQPKQYELKASPDTDDPPGKSSCFVSSDPELCAVLDNESASPRLVLEIKGKSYRGEIKHNHDATHAHDH